MPEPPSHFTWYKGLQILSSGASIQQLPPGSSGSNTKIVAVKNKVSIETSTNGLENQLLIRNAAPATDAGNYTCVPAGAEPASIVVHVLNGMLPPKLIIYYLYVSNRHYSIVVLDDKITKNEISSARVYKIVIVHQL